MKIDRSKLKKSTSEVPADCKNLIEKLKGCSQDQFLAELRTIETWTYGKCELYHWIDILDLCDDILESATVRAPGSWVLACDQPGQGAKHLKELVLWTLHFTTLLIEHSFSRHLYSSMEHLSLLLSSFDLDVVLAVLNLLYMFSKRSNFISRLAPDKRALLLTRLSHLAASWGGKDNGFGLSVCCSDEPISAFPPSATTLHFEFYAEADKSEEGKCVKKNQTSSVTVIHVEGLDKMQKTPAKIMEDLLEQFNVPEEKQMLLFTYVRLAHGFSDYKTRLKSVQARLQALSVLIYSNQLTDSIQSLLYSGLLEELVDVLEMKGEHLMDIKAAALKSLTSIIHLDRNPNFPKLNTIIDVTGAASYHGFLPVMVRNCISSLTGGSSTPPLPLPSSSSQPFPQPLATALFSFLYHLASYEAGGEALVSCGMMESLLKVIQWPSSELEHITFVTRAVRVIDLITNLDMASFQTHTGLNTFIARLQSEVDTCRLHQPFQISIERNTQDRLTTAMEQAETINDPALLEAQQQVEIELQQQQGNTSNTSFEAPETSMEVDAENSGESEVAPNKVNLYADQLPVTKSGLICLPQRAALLKSMLNFLKKAIQDPAFSDSIRHVMDGSLPNSLKHIISNAEYYGPSLFLLATDVVTAYVFQEPSLLSSLQDKGLTDVVLHALLVKDVPATREVLASLPNVFSALCLNTRGLEAFVECKPFERLFKVLLSPDYLPAMRRRRSADPLGDTATNLGNAMDELMRHQPSLKQSATAAIIKLLEQVCALGRDPRYVCWKPANSKESSGSNSNGSHLPLARGGGGEASSDEEEEDDDNGAEAGTTDPLPAPSPSPEKEPVPLVDYVLNVMKFVDAILSNNSTDDHCREFVSQKGLVPLMGILGLPNLPIDFPAQPACQAVGAVCKSILNLAHEPQVLKQGLLHLNDVLKQLEPLHTAVPPPGGSVLLRELVSSPNIAEATSSPTSTPLLHHMSAAHAYIQMFVHVCRTGQADIRTISVGHWGSELGLSVLAGLSRLYTSLVWESTVLLALCSEDTLPQDCMFGRHDMEKLVPADQSPSSPASHGSSGEVTSAMENLTTDSNMEAEIVMENSSDMEIVQGPEEKKTNPLLQCQIKQIKPLLSGSSRLGRALAELFGLLVKLCVGSPLRQRRGQVNQPTPATPSPPARAVATALTKLLTSGLSWEPPATSPLPKFRLTFFICSVGFTSPMLFDEKKFPYHLMLMKFLSSGGQQAFFNTFNWAITLGNSVPAADGLESSGLPDGTGEFLDAWLMLLEKMVNPKTVNESPHVLPSKAAGNFKPFDSLRYLIKTHKMAFEAVMMIWGRKPLPVYGGRMAESVLAILCHILKGEKIIAEKLEKEKPPPVIAEKSSESGVDPPTPAPGAVSEPNWSASTPAEPDVNPEHLQTLMDMGFPRERCVEAMTAVGGSLDAATDYLLNNPLPPLQQSLPSGFGPGGEQDDLMRAIAMSLGENVMVSTDGSETGAQSSDVKETEQLKEEEEELSSDEQEALKKQVIDTFTETALTGCLTLLDTLPETVYKVTDLLMAIFNRNGKEFKEKLLTQLMGEVKKSVEELLSVAHSGQDATKEGLESARAAVRIHLFTLLFEDCSRLCVQLVEGSGAIELMVQLIGVAQEALQIAPSKTSETPKWITPMLLFIDLYEKVVLAMKRRDAMTSICSNNWKWFDVGAGKWQGYQPGNNKTINDAFWAGESSVKFTTGRRKYNIQFGAMMQANEETGNRRPLMITLKRDEKDQESSERKGRWKKDDTVATENKDDIKEDSGNSPDSSSEPEKMEISPSDVEKQDDTRELKSNDSCAQTSYKCSGLSSGQSQALLRAAVGLIAVPVEPDALNAILRLCLRLTRTFSHATLFAELGGIKLLLSLKQSSSFSGFSSLASLLVRHVLEDDMTLRHTMEKIIRSSAATSTAATTKELHYLLRSLAPAACRQPDTFTNVAKDILRVDISLLSKRGEPEDDHRLLVKSLAGKASVPAPPLKDVSKGVISDLLDFLVQSDPDEPIESEQVGDVTSKPEELSELPTSVASILNGGNNAAQSGSRGPAVVRQISSELIPGEKKEEAVKESKDSKELEDARKKRHLLPKSAVCRLLAEMVKSYAGCARLITEHVYPGGISELVKDDCSALAFILDELLTSTKDKESATLVKMLVAALASCNHAPEAQTSLVTEVKNALTRALSLPECTMKHTKVQALTGLISTMIENCPASVSTNQPPFKSGQVNMNNIVKCMVKRGLITDLARVSHALDLSSPSMAATVNAALKPLETLSRIVNQPSGLLPPTQNKSKPKNDESRSNEANNGNTNTTNSEATRAQNDEIAGIDNEATEHDVSTTAESMDPNSESQLHTVEEGDAEDFDEMMEQLLEQDRGDTALLEVAVISRGDTSQNMETDDTINDSQMMSQEESFVEGEGDAEEDSDTDSSHSQETEGSGAEEEDLEENDDEGDDDEDDEEDEDDDAGSDVYDDEQEFQDLEDAFFRMPGTGGNAERDQENVMMIGHVNDDPLLDDRAISVPLWGDMATSDGASAADNLANNGTSGPSGVAPSHPLLMGRTEQVVPAGSARGQGRSLTRQRGFRYIQLNPRNGSGGPGTPAILQSLLGHNSGRDFLQLTGNHPGLNVGAMRDATRVLVMDSGSGFAILDSLEDEIPGLEGLGQGGGSALSTVPNALVRWTEESRVLDGDSLHDCMTVCKPPLLDVIEKHREEELAERKEKKKKLLEEEEARKKKEDEERKKREPEAATTPAPESAGVVSGTDEMDVVVSENAAVHSAVDTIASSTGSITDTAHRLAEDLANAISNRVSTSFPNMSAQAISTTAAQDTHPQFTFQSAGGLLSSLQDLLPSQGQESIPPASLSSVLQSLQSGYQNTGSAVGSVAPAPPDTNNTNIVEPVTTTAEALSGLPPTFQFATPPPLFPTLPIAPPTLEAETGPAPLPDALGPLSPSPDQETQPTEPVDTRDVSMASEPEVDVERIEPTESVAPIPVSTVEQNTSSAATTPAPIAGSSGISTGREPDFSAILGDIDIPEGVDPSFLAALPEDMRQEVIEEQRRLVRARQQPPPQPAPGGTAQGMQEVNPEFLAALPPNIQEEVLAQQRLEQQRQNAAQADPSAPVDPGEFLQTLPPSLRQSLLADMEESQISALPADLAAEAQNLRRDYEQRSRQMMHERFFNHVNHTGPTLSSILRNTVNRLGNQYAIHTGSGGPGRSNLWRSIGRGGPGHQQSAAALAAANNVKFRGRQLLDHEGLSCLLILLFIDDAKLNTTRLHRILRNLCYHAPTRDWVVKCLLSILEKANVGSENATQLIDPVGSGSNTPTPAKMRKSMSRNSDVKDNRTTGQTSWLNISMDAALGFRANVFQVQRSQSSSGKKSSSGNLASIAVHPQAAPVVCRHTLEVLISLAKSFPIHFLPGAGSSNAPPTSDNTPSDKKSSKPAEFWETILKLDRECWSSKKGKSVVRSHSSVSIKSEDDEAGNSALSFSAFGQLLSMLASPVIKRSSLLTDKLLRLLSLISLGQPDVLKRLDDSSRVEENSDGGLLVDKAIKEEQIQLAVEVLTSKACSEEGLEDVTALLLNLSYGGTQTRESILHLLLAGARQLGNVVSAHVSDLLNELAQLKSSGGLATMGKDDEDEGKHKGVMADRFTKESVVLTAPAKPKGGGELQLSSMTALTNKTSSQSFFLRVLKVIIQLREAALLAIKKAQKAKKEAEAKKKESETMATLLENKESDETKEDNSSSTETPKETSVTQDVVATAMEVVANAVSANMTTQAPASTSSTTPMEVESEAPECLESLSDQLNLTDLWATLSSCLKELAETPDHHAVLVLQPTVEAFFLVHAAVVSSEEKKKPNQKETRKEQLAHIEEKEGQLESEQTPQAVVSVEEEISQDTKKFLAFAETHRTVLNQILRQSTTHLADGPFSVLVDHTRVLDFDIKRRYFRTELERLDEGIRREDLAVHVRRDAVFEESFRELHRKSAEEWKNRFYIVFEGEEGQDAGGLLREWYVIISREIFNPNYALFKSSPGDRVTYTINDFSHINSNHLCYFKFVGRVIAKAIYDNKLLECYFTRSFYKHILAKAVKHQDMESEDYEFYKGLDFLLENKVSDLGYDLTFSTEIQEFGVTEVRDLIADGRNVIVTDQNKADYIRLVCQMKMTGAIRKQLAAFLEGFYDIIPRRLIAIFNEQELELLLSGLPDINIDDLKANSEYHKYSVTSLQIVWFWRALRSFDQTDRAKFLQFVTGSSKVPLQGFGALEGMNGAQKFQIHRDDRSTDRLPAAHTCFNQLDLPAYETYDKLRTYLLKAIQECSEGFGFA